MFTESVFPSSHMFQFVLGSLKIVWKWLVFTKYELLTRKKSACEIQVWWNVIFFQLYNFMSSCLLLFFDLDLVVVIVFIKFHIHRTHLSAVIIVVVEPCSLILCRYRKIWGYRHCSSAARVKTQHIKYNTNHTTHNA